MSRRAKDGEGAGHEWPLALLACPNPDCLAFNCFGAGNLSVCELMGKDKSIRRLYCNVCHARFSERQGSLMQYTKLPEPVVVRMVKCLGHGCTVEATADPGAPGRGRSPHGATSAGKSRAKSPGLPSAPTGEAGPPAGGRATR